MFNCYYSCSVPMKPEMEKLDLDIEDEDVDVGMFELPEIYYTGFADPNEAKPMFGWGVDSVFVKRGNHIVKYEEISQYDVLLKADNGECEWQNGKVSEILGFSANEVVDFRPAKEYRIEEYDLEKSLIKRYKVTLEETSEMSEFDYKNFTNTILSK